MRCVKALLKAGKEIHSSEAQQCYSYDRSMYMSSLPFNLVIIDRLFLGLFFLHETFTHILDRSLVAFAMISAFGGHQRNCSRDVND